MEVELGFCAFLVSCYFTVQREQVYFFKGRTYLERFVGMRLFFL